MDMYRLLKPLAALALGLLLVACSESGSGAFDSNARLDTSSEDAMSASMEAMMEGMDKADQQKLAGALAGIMMIRGFQLMGEDLSEEETHARIMEGLHGLTASEIIAKAEEVAAEAKAAQ